MKFSKSLSDLHVSVAEIGLSKYEDIRWVFCTAYWMSKSWDGRDATMP